MSFTTEERDKMKERAIEATQSRDEEKVALGGDVLMLLLALKLAEEDKQAKNVKRSRSL